MTIAHIEMQAECEDVDWVDMKTEMQCIYTVLRDAIESMGYNFWAIQVKLDNANPSISCSLEV